MFVDEKPKPISVAARYVREPLLPQCLCNFGRDIPRRRRRARALLLSTSRPKLLKMRLSEPQPLLYGRKLSTAVGLGTDVIFFAKTGNVKLFANDLAGALFGEIRIGSLGNRLQRATGPGGRSTTDQVAKKLADAVQSANAGFLWPELCK